MDPDTHGSTAIRPQDLSTGSQHPFPMARDELLPKNLWGLAEIPGCSRHRGGNGEIGTAARKETLIGYFWTTGS